jgi:hypothetical protein
MCAPGHANHIDETLANRIARRRDVGDTRRVKDGHPRLPLESAHHLQKRRDGLRHARHIMLSEGEFGVHPTEDTIKKIDLGLAL